MVHACFFHKKRYRHSKYMKQIMVVMHNGVKYISEREFLFLYIAPVFSWDISSVFTGVSILLWNEADTNFSWRYRCFKNRNVFSKMISSHCEIYCRHLLKPHSMCNVCDICTAFLFLDMYNTKETIRTDVRLFVSYDS